jgi:hypothetical protein
MIGPLFNGRGGFLAGPPSAARLFKLAADAQEFTLSGLDGDAELGYRIRAELYISATASEYIIKPNGLTTNQRWAVTTVDLAPSTQRQETEMVIVESGAYTAPAWVSVEIVIEATRTIGGLAHYRAFRSEATVNSDAAGAHTYRFRGAGSWRDGGAANLTSLVFRAQAGVYILANSQAIVEPLSSGFSATAA